MKTITSERKPIKVWAKNIDEGTMEQATNLANLPFAFKHIAIMPDCHLGYGMPIGGVLATEDVIVPNAVGSDIGCGMCALKTSLKEIDTDTLKKITEEIKKVVPVGPNSHKEKQYEDLMPWGGKKIDINKILLPVVYKEYDSALKQIGTLGGGNHFIEIQKGSDDHIWIMIHSGSRNLGKQVADYYNRIAKNLNKKWHSIVPEKSDLAFLPVDSKEGKTYIKEMNYCIEYALANRMLMMSRITKIFSETCEDWAWFKGYEKENLINIAHNYAKLENHYGKNVWVHRKGATSAKEGEIGIIPGSQGTNSYIVEGLGNRESFMSCSHGAGRVLGRKQAIKTLDLKAEIKRLDEKGIIHGITSRKNLEEAPSAYKDIDEVMACQKDLTKVLIKLKPLAVVKG